MVTAPVAVFSQTLPTLSEFASGELGSGTL
jgi:hypothetical protein